jgi:hypothetical protein
VTETTYDCPTCRCRQAFELLLVDDDPGTEIPEWICTMCGTALFADLTDEVGWAIAVERPTHVA